MSKSSPFDRAPMFRRVPNHTEAVDDRTPVRLPPFRDGAATVEFSVCLPVVVAIVFGAIEAANALYLKQSVVTSAYEAAREATRIGGVDADARAAAQAVLDAKGVTGATVTIDPVVTLTTASGTEVTVTVTAPASANAIGPQFYYETSTIRSVVSMVRQ